VLVFNVAEIISRTKLLKSEKILPHPYVLRMEQPVYRAAAFPVCSGVGNSTANVKQEDRFNFFIY
jgi:hypothetical protein